MLHNLGSECLLTAIQCCSIIQCMLSYVTQIIEYQSLSEMMSC